MKKKLLSLILVMACLFGTRVQAQTTLFIEDFSSGALPSGWTNDSLGMPALHLWYFNNPHGQIITGGGFDTNFAIFDSDDGGVNNNIDELASLTTPNIDISTATTSLFLEMSEQYRPLLGPFSGGSAKTILYSTNLGVSWDTLVFDSLGVGYPNPAVQSSYNLSTLVGVANDLMIRFTWTGSWDWWWAIDNVRIITYPNCTAPPVAGNAVSDTASVCTGQSFNLSLVGADAGIDLTYQWQSSPDNINWTDISGATSKVLMLTQTSATYYRCNVTCTGQTVASGEVMVGMNAATDCYCVAPHSVDCTGLNSAITNVTITGTALNHNSACDQLTAMAYTIWPSSPSTFAMLNRGSSYNIGVTTDNDNITSVWIDFNQNGVFESTEWWQVSTTSTAGSASTINIAIPGTANLGATKMRVRTRLTTNQNGAGDACLSFGSGETEDYNIEIQDFTGVNQIILSDSRIYPNPANGQVQIEFGKQIEKALVFICDQLGRKVTGAEIISDSKAILDLNDLASGIYTVRIESADGIASHKLTIAR
ncbi:MAG: T9SS C-terminal target domain-containing protein [Bacteroidetes bacterium]|nr:MAG: T9SS C-terminal target domain-containing protein [Bacteroidota bacterium]REK04926.1 MAG: T9SS C-terminal target domain-containing protein [Bacteroidota bacterium]REK32875.1 MAG: T9SS C-terminal target domain-containing protein [Bacteroidota bacterium]REK50936.1 MAG: T9SS C-terminal target domain-containing protein [Bacteroidota bacterium]